MKKIILGLFIMCVTVPAMADERKFQVGGDFIVPWTVDSPRDRRGMQVGGHLDGYLNDHVTFGSGVFVNVENDNSPVYITPGFTFYMPTPGLKPFIRANAPIRLTDNTDVGVQGGLGAMLKGGPLGFQYSVDATYFFDSERYVVNWVHASLVFIF